MTKEQYMEAIIDLMKNCDDMVLLDFIKKLLQECL